MGNQRSFVEKQFEEKFPGRRIVFACDAGSRVWGWSHEGSDYDVHIVYVHTDFRFYCRLNTEPRETLYAELRTQDGIEVNVAGYELGNFFRLYSNSNPAVNKMFLTTSKFFYPGFEDLFHESCIPNLFLRNYSIKAVAMSKIRRIRDNFKKHLMGREYVRVKAYIYVIHDIIFLNHVVKHYDSYESGKSFPLIRMDKLMDDLTCHPYIREEIDRLLTQKRNYDESNPSKTEDKRLKKVKDSCRLFTKRRKILELWVIICRINVRNFVKKKRGRLMNKEMVNKLFIDCLTVAHPKLKDLW